MNASRIAGWAGVSRLVAWGEGQRTLCACASIISAIGFEIYGDTNMAADERCGSTGKLIQVAILGAQGLRTGLAVI